MRGFGLAAILMALLSSMMSQNPPTSQCQASSSVIEAVPVSAPIALDAAHPAAEWQHAVPVSFCSDWQGKNPDPGRLTRVRVLWSPQTLYLRFECRYRELFVFDDAAPSGRRDHLWDRDVAEAFLQPDRAGSPYYKEFEISPNGMWIDLDISPAPRKDLESGLQRSVTLDKATHTWAAELAIPMKSLTSHFDSGVVWRANFYRVEGGREPRAYLAWQPTHTAETNFHVPSAFGTLRFAQPTHR